MLEESNRGLQDPVVVSHRLLRHILIRHRLRPSLHRNSRVPHRRGTGPEHDCGRPEGFDGDSEPVQPGDEGAMPEWGLDGTWWVHGQ